MFAGGPEHAGVANEVVAWRRDDADEPAQKRDRLEHEVRATIGPQPREFVRDIDSTRASNTSAVRPDAHLPLRATGFGR